MVTEEVALTKYRCRPRSLINVLLTPGGRHRSSTLLAGSSSFSPGFSFL